MDCFDVVIIGGGPGGYVAAIRARQLGLSTALVESTHLGGVCLNWGCIPTKALLKSSHLFHMAHTLRTFGVSVSQVSAEVETMVQRSRHISSGLALGIKGLLSKNKVKVYEGWGRVGALEEGARTVSIHKHQEGDAPQHFISGRHIIIATGARARRLFEPALGLWTAREAMMPEKIPASLLIIGAGAIGIEFASFYRALGTEVTLVEQASQILPVEDEEISALAHKEFSRQGIRFHLGHTLQEVRQKDASTYTATLKEISSQKELVWEGEKILLAIGVIGNTEHLGLESTRVKIHQGHIQTHGCSRTDEPGIYAIGDVAGPPWLAHKASHEGVSCVESIAGRSSHQVDPSLIPGCTYSSPQIASIGLTEKQARQQNIEIKIGSFPFSANGQAMAQGESVGLVKVIFGKETGELLGAHMIGQGVTELIQGFTIAKTLEATEDDLKKVIFPHPTLSEMMHEAVLDADEECLHLFRSSSKA